MRAPHLLTRVPSHLRCSCPCVAERWGLWGRSSYLYTNAGLCGPLVSVGTSYSISGTNLNSACSSRMEDQLAYLACLASPSTCTRLCVSLPLPLKCF